MKKSRSKMCGKLRSYTKKQGINWIVFVAIEYKGKNQIFSVNAFSKAML